MKYQIKLDIFTCEKNIVIYHRRYGYIINHAFHTNKTIREKWFGISLVFI